VALTTVACSAATPGQPHAAITVTSSASERESAPPTSTSAAPGPTARTDPPPTAGPATGGVAFLRLVQHLVDARRQPVNDLSTAMKAGDVAKTTASARKLRDAEYAFAVAARQVTVTPTARNDLYTVLRDENTLIGDLDKAAAATTMAQFNKAYSAVGIDAPKMSTAAMTVLTDLDVATTHPAAHLAPHDLPPAVQPVTNSRLFSAEGSAATYTSAGYRLSVSGRTGSVQEDLSRPVHLGDTSVTADVTMTGPATTAYVACRSSGGGTAAGRGYYLGITNDGSFYVQLIDTDTHAVVNLAGGSSPAIKTGNGAKNVIRGDCIGHYLTLFANSQPLMQVYDDRLDRGNAGIAMSAAGGPGTVEYTGFSVFGTAAG
jgi:hypothetical protein